MDIKTLQNGSEVCVSKSLQIPKSVLPPVSVSIGVSIVSVRVSVISAIVSSIIASVPGISLGVGLSLGFSFSLPFAQEAGCKVGVCWMMVLSITVCSGIRKSSWCSRRWISFGFPLSQIMAIVSISVGIPIISIPVGISIVS